MTASDGMTGRLPLWAALTLVLSVSCGGGPSPAPPPTASPAPAPARPPTGGTPLPVRPPPPSPTRTPSPTPSPAPGATPAPTLRQLTTGGCCTRPFWSPDGGEVWYLDKPAPDCHYRGPAPDAPTGIWGVDLAGGQPRFVGGRPGILSPDGALVAYPQGGQTYIQRLADGQRWSVPSGGRAISFSPDGARIAWQTASSSVNFDSRTVEIWLAPDSFGNRGPANVDGSAARRVATLTGGGLSDWFPDGERLLVSGREAGGRGFLAALNLADGALSVIARGERLRGGTVSPGGGWVAWSVTFSGDPAADGLWVARADGTGARRLIPYGAYRWRREGRLLLIPLEANAGVESHRLLEVEAATGQLTPLTDPTITRFRIAGGDWALSPDGDHVAFVSAADHNIWVIDLPG